jgi:hypothetical protein
MTEDEVFLFTEETLSQLYFLMDKGDITSEEAYKIFMRLPISRAMFLPTVEQLEENPTIYNRHNSKMVNGDDYEDEEGVTQVNSGRYFFARTLECILYCLLNCRTATPIAGKEGQWRQSGC